jgi:hypothetical protein
MRAEGYARTNQISKTLQDLNYLRKFRMKAGTDIADKCDNLSKVYINLILLYRRDYYLNI